MDNRRRMMLATLGGGIPLSDLPEGSILKILEGGVLTDFYVAKHNYESGLNGSLRTLLVRKDVYSVFYEWHTSNVNAYATSDIDAWLNGDYKALLSSKVQKAIKTTKFYYTPGNGNTTVGTLSRAIFLLSVTELGQSSSNANVEGSALSIAGTLKIAYLNGSAITQWTRSPYTHTPYRAWYLNPNGGINNCACSDVRATRPAFTLPADAPCKPNADGNYTLSI